MKNKKIIAVFVLACGISTVLQATPPDNGKTIFLSRCAACHNINRVLTGPALAGVDQRHTLDWIINFVHSSQSVIKGGDPAASALFEKFNKVVMPDHADLTTDNIKSIVEYIKSESLLQNNNNPPFAKPGKKQTLYLPIQAGNYVFFGGFIAVVIALIAALFYAVYVKSFQRMKEGDNSSA